MRTMVRLRWFALLLVTASALGQSSVRSTGTSRDRVFTFSITKPVMGLPVKGSRMQGLCSSDGLSYFDPFINATGNSRVLDLYGVNASGEVRHLSRTAPIEFTNVIHRDFFPGDAALVTLMEAQKRDSDDADARVRETQYFLSVQDHDGDGKKMIALDVPFKPLKVGQFGSGEFLVLGWEGANELAQLAILKEDGTLRRFVDVDERPAGAQAKAARREGATLASLTGAAFVPFGRSVLLTFPGTVRPIFVFHGSGSGSPLALEIPAGWQLHDVLNSGFGMTLVARVQEMRDAETGNVGKAEAPRQRMFEFNAFTGRRIREFSFDNVPIAAVTCAAGRSLAAIFEQPVGDAGKDDKAMELVVGTVLE